MRGAACRPLFFMMTRMVKNIALRTGLIWLAAAVILMAGCRPNPAPPPAPQPSASPANTLPTQPVPTTPTPEPPRLLSICIGKEPSSLFVYADSSTAARAVGQALYDGPVDWLGYQPQAVILEQVPSQANGGVRRETVTAQAGDLVVDAGGELVALTAQVHFRPAGCQDESCAQVFAGQSEAALDQMVVTFRLRPGLVWSDGAPLTAGDSTFAFRTAQALFPAVQPELLRRTAAYSLVDEQTVEWRGLPGYLEPQAAGLFFFPLPEHILGQVAPAELPNLEQAARAPLGWGPYLLQEWIPGDHLTMMPSPRYFRQAEGLPRFDTLVFRFTPEPQAAIEALLAGECDLVDESVGLESRLTDVLALQQNGQIQAAITPRGGWEQLLFGMAPGDPNRPALFAQKEVRQAAAMCINRQNLASAATLGQSPALNTVVLPDHPVYDPQWQGVDYDPTAGAAMLQAAGWLDEDQNPSTPRQAQGVAGVPDGTPLQAELLAAEGDSRRLAAEMIVEALAGCGIGLELRYLSAAELLAPGPQGPVFGRNFDLALFGWAASLEPPCQLFLSSQIPAPAEVGSTGWGGANAAGYQNPAFDQACRQAKLSLSDDTGYLTAYRQALLILGEDLPALPLFAWLRVTAARADLCGLQIDASASSPIWNLESLDYGETCQ